MIRFCIITLIFSFLARANADGGHLLGGGGALAPMNAVIFCIENPSDCEIRPGNDKQASSRSETAIRNELVSVNDKVNRAIVSDIDKRGDPGIDKWLISPPTGNCADFAVTKRHELLALGWPSSSLRLATVLTPVGAGHVVLVVRMRERELVLDSINPKIVSVSACGYTWVSIQSSENPKFWVMAGARRG